MDFGRDCKHMKKPLLSPQKQQHHGNVDNVVRKMSSLFCPLCFFFLLSNILLNLINLKIFISILDAIKNHTIPNLFIRFKAGVYF